MIVTLAAIGRLKSDCAEQLLTKDWIDRAHLTGRNLGFKQTRLLEVEQKSAHPQPDKEAQLLLSALEPNKAGLNIVLLDEHGADLGSVGLANLLNQWKDQGLKETALVIGGADGHGAAIRAAAQKTLAFGRWTWPHRLVRAMAAEQIYRAMTILAETPYHRV